MRQRKFVIAMLLILGTAGPVFAGNDVPIEMKREFREKVAQRNRLVRELATLDAKAADATVAGRNPVALHAEQIEVQDRVDLIQLRLETMAVRWDLDIPAPPSTDPAAIADRDAEVTARVGAVFDDGRVRANAVLRARCLRMLATIDYGAFLRKDK